MITTKTRKRRKERIAMTMIKMILTMIKIMILTMIKKVILRTITMMTPTLTVITIKSDGQ